MSRRGRAGSRRGAAAGALVSALALACAACSREAAVEAETILENARLGPAGAGVAGVSIALAGGRILAIGEAEAIARHRGGKTAGVDLAGALVVPGFEDALARPIEAGERRLNEALGGTVFLDLSGSETEEDAVQRVRQRARALGPGEWILGHGWDETRWVVARPPDARLLSDIVRYNPVLLVRRDGASVWVNRKALDAAGLDKVQVPVAASECVAILRRAPGLAPDDRRVAIETALKRSVAAGVVAVRAVASTGRLGLQDRAAPPALVLDPWRDLARGARLPVRVSLLVPAPSAAAEALVASGPESYPGGGRLEIRTLLLDATGIATAPDEGAAWARRGAAAGLDITVEARAASLRTALEWLAEARRARADVVARLVLTAGSGLDDAAVAVLAGAGVEVGIESGSGDAAGAAALADRLRRSGIAVVAATGADGPPAPALARFVAGPWTSVLAAGGPAEFLVLPRDGVAPPAGSDAPGPIAPLAVLIGGVETYRRDAPGRH